MAEPALENFHCVALWISLMLICLTLLFLYGFLAKTAEGWEVVGTVSKPEDVENVPVISCLEFRWNKPVIIVIGSEGDGLSLETQLLCHRMLAIPPGRVLHPGIESLNVSVATGKNSSERKGERKCLAGAPAESSHAPCPPCAPCPSPPPP
uniref:tRNA/rRNA methyltransferase SpoU type domain-containing protein n=1 Tax=Buteo japonicus TaxID=224669 RepID=A0A8C0BF10_9AVES